MDYRFTYMYKNLRFISIYTVYTYVNRTDLKYPEITKKNWQNKNEQVRE